VCAWAALGGCAPVDNVHSERSALVVRFIAGSGACTDEELPQNECTSFEFTEIRVGEIAEAAFSLKNSGDAPLTFTLSLASSSDEAFSLAEPLPGDGLAAGGLDHAHLVCEPSETGRIEGRILIETDAANVPGNGTSILLSAEADEAPPPP
jgi:hypothetical protein